MSGRSKTQLIAIVVGLVLVLGSWLSGSGFQIQLLRYCSAAVLVATLALTVWDRVFWHLPLAQRFASVARDLRGTWRGTLVSHWQDPNTGHSPPPKVVYLVVRQSSETVRVTLFTDESRSSSTFGVVTTGDEVSLEYMYLNRPGNAIEHRSRRHSGSTSLDIVGRPATRLIGHYWTDRDTRGELDFVERSTRQAESFDSARSLFG